MLNALQWNKNLYLILQELFVFYKWLNLFTQQDIDNIIYPLHSVDFKNLNNEKKDTYP